jgi:hypothetical protein
MKFAIALISFWQNAGFNVDRWRKSVDKTKALVHLEYAKVLVPDAETNPEVTIYTAPSEEFSDLLNSEEWAPQEEAL